jgi:hypothetical protein
MPLAQQSSSEAEMAEKMLPPVAATLLDGDVLHLRLSKNEERFVLQTTALTHGARTVKFIHISHRQAWFAKFVVGTRASSRPLRASVFLQNLRRQAWNSLLPGASPSGSAASEKLAVLDFDGPALKKQVRKAKNKVRLGDVVEIALAVSVRAWSTLGSDFEQWRDLLGVDLPPQTVNMIVYLRASGLHVECSLVNLLAIKASILEEILPLGSAWPSRGHLVSSDAPKRKKAWFCSANSRGNAYWLVAIGRERKKFRVAGKHLTPEEYETQKERVRIEAEDFFDLEAGAADNSE